MTDSEEKTIFMFLMFYLSQDGKDLGSLTEEDLANYRKRAILQIEGNAEIKQAILERDEYLEGKKQGKGFDKEDFSELENNLFLAVAKDIADGGDLVKIIGPLDNKTCDHCRKWTGKIVSLTGKNPNYPSWAEFAEHTHPFCRHSFGKIEKLKIVNSCCFFEL